MSIKQRTAQDKIERLTINAAKYKGKNPGESVSCDEIVNQGLANGYSERQLRDWLTETCGEAQSVVVPEQTGDTLGSLWNPSEPSLVSSEATEGELTDSKEGDSSDNIQAFRDWCEERASAEEDHTYTRRRANRRFAQGKDVDRRFVRENDVFSTVLITYTLPREPDERLVEHANRFYPRATTQRRRRILKKAGVYEEMGGVSVFAPKKRPEDSDRVPDPSGLTTHCHDFLWLPRKIEESEFDRLQNVDDFDVEISVRTHVSSEVESPEAVSEIDRQRGDTTALPQELGANLPLLNCQFDARGVPEYIERWAAAMRLGRDESLNTAGFRRVRKLGAFDEQASAERRRRQMETAVSRAIALKSELEYLWPSPSQSESNSNEEAETDSHEEADARTNEREGHGERSDRVPDPSGLKGETDSPEFDFSEVDRQPTFTFPD